MADDWSISIPLADLVALQALPGKLEKLERENAQLRSEQTALYGLYSQVLQKLGDLQQEVRKR